MPDSFGLVPKVINGGVAGIVGVSCVFPLDLVKTRLQNQVVQPDGTRAYNGIFDCFVKTFKRGGFRGMYQGCGVNVFLITPEKAIKLVANDFFRYVLRRDNEKTLPIWKGMIAGGGAGFCQIIVTTPMELLKIQLQDAGRTGDATKRLSARDITANLLKSKGIVGLYRGTGATMFRDVTFSMIYFPLFAVLDSLGPRKTDGSGHAVFYASFISGIMAGATASLCVTPIDVVKTRLQLLRRGPQDKAYRGVGDAFSRIFREEGIRALFKGGLSRAIVIAPLFGIAQMVYYVGVAEMVLGVDRHSLKKV